MAKIVTKKNIYLLALFVICLLGIVIVPTYAKFGSNYQTSDEIVGLQLGFNVSITNVEEYQTIQIPSGGSEKFNIQITNGTGSTVYYGVWYRMVSPNSLTNDIEIGKVSGSTVATTASIDHDAVVNVPISIINSSDTTITVDIGVATSDSSTSDIEYLDGKNLITGIVQSKDISITSILIDGEESDSLPTSGTYTMNATCTKGSTLTWNTYNKNITYGAGANMRDDCALVFTTSTDYPLLNTMPVGSYVAYQGSSGYVGDTLVSCKRGGTASSVETSETESPNSCYGQNAREDLDALEYASSENYSDESVRTYGYCYNSSSRYYTTGWRIAYISGNKPIIVSAGSPECVSFGYVTAHNTKALKYCNTAYVDGNCVCADSNGDGYCDSASSDAWAINDTDFYYMTKAISGVGKRLAENSSQLGDYEGILGSRLYCDGLVSYPECGYNNDLIDNGSFYFFAATTNSNSLLATSDIWWNSMGVSGVSNSEVYAGLRPVISLSATVYVTGGAGTMDDPYIIGN